MAQKPVIGFIGQGYIGKNYADDFEQRGFEVVRYAKEKPYQHNKDALNRADFIFIAVPTPTRSGKCDVSIVREVLGLVPDGKTVIIKSTVVPGTTDHFQEAFPKLTLLFSPEFLVAATAAYDAAHPIMNIVGVPALSGRVHREAAEQFLSLLPTSPHNQISSAREAEIIKYGHNLHGIFRILFANILYEAAATHAADWEHIRTALDADPYLSKEANYYNHPVHKGGRGAGGACFPKDLAAFTAHYEEVVQDKEGLAVLDALMRMNNVLLMSSGKDALLLKEIHGDDSVAAKDPVL